MVPNGKIFGDIIKNASAYDTRRVELVIGIGYTSDIQKAQEMNYLAASCGELTLVRRIKPCEKLKVVTRWNKSQPTWSGGMSGDFVSKSIEEIGERKMFKEFKEFAMRGNVVDMAVGIIIGAAFGTIVKSLVADVIMPPIGLLLGNVDFTNLFIVLREGTVAGPFASLAEAQKAGAVTINYGVFINTIISFIIVAFAVFLIIRNINKLKRKEESPPEEPMTKACPHCFSTIPIKATRCAFCTSEL